MAGPDTSVWLQVTAGQGPDECALAVNKLTDYLIATAPAQGIKANLVDAVPGSRPGTSETVGQPSALIAGWHIGAGKRLPACNAPDRCA